MNFDVMLASLNVRLSLFSAMRQKKVVPQSPTDVDEYNSLVNSFMATDSQMPNVAFRENPKKVQVNNDFFIGFLSKRRTNCYSFLFYPLDAREYSYNLLKEYFKL